MAQAARTVDQAPQEVLAGIVERVTYHNDESGFCVLRVKARGHRDLVTVVGHSAAIAAGEWITATGEWLNDRTHGLQFKARFLKTTPPTTAEGIEKYLSSGMIRGIGPVYAQAIIAARPFRSVEELTRIRGISPRLVERLRDRIKAAHGQRAADLR